MHFKSIYKCDIITFSNSRRNMELNFSNHAITRCQQRGIPLEVLNFLYKYGNKIQTHQDKKYFCNKKLLKKLFIKEKALIKKFDKQILNTAIVCNGNTVITAMKITEGIR